jgi:hypothetical protein
MIEPSLFLRLSHKFNQTTKCHMMEESNNNDHINSSTPPPPTTARITPIYRDKTPRKGLLDSSSTHSRSWSRIDLSGYSPFSTSMRIKKPRKELLDSSSRSTLSRSSSMEDMSGHSPASSSIIIKKLGKGLLDSCSTHSSNFQRQKKANSNSIEEQAAALVNAERRLVSQISFADAELFSFAADDSWLEFCEDLTLEEIK